MNIFFLTDRNKKETGVSNPNVKPQQIKSVGVSLASSGPALPPHPCDMAITITDAIAPALAGGVQKVLEEVSFSKASRGPDAQKMVKYAPLVNATTTDSEFGACDLVIEAIIEKPEAKQEMYARIEPKMKDGLASNTSAISITRLAEKLSTPSALRHPLLQPGPANAAGRGDPRRKNERRDDRPFPMPRALASRRSL